MEFNPYESPRDSQPAAKPEAGNLPTAFFAWERLRIWYNAALVVAVVLGSMPAPQNMLRIGFVANVLEGVILVNLGFSLGMLVEFYLLWLGWWQEWMRLGLFLLGTGISVVGALAVTLVMVTGGV